MSSPTNPPLNPTNLNLADELKKISMMLRNAALNSKQWNNLLAKHDQLNVLWGKPSFILDLHSFLVENLQTGSFDTWMLAIEKLGKYSYKDPDLKGFLKSVNTANFSDMDMSDYNLFKQYLLGNSDLNLDDNQKLLFRERQIG